MTSTMLLLKGLLGLPALYIHIDESGNLNLANRQNPECYPSKVSHDQDDDISSEIAFPDAELLSMNCNVECNSVEKT